jgi:hypothetical protein
MPLCWLLFTAVIGDGISGKSFFLLVLDSDMQSAALF